MIIRITDRCERGCSHCMYDCTAKGKDMELDLFKSIIDKLNVAFIHIGGGESMLHPNIIEMIDYACSQNRIRPVTIITAGIKLYEIKKLMKRHSNLMVQITNDERYYPKSTAIDGAIENFMKTADHSKSVLVKSLVGIVELGRAKGKYVGNRTKAPCLNIMLCALQTMIKEHTRPQLINLELTLVMSGQFCSLNIDADGYLNAGECKYLRLSDMRSDRWWEDALHSMMNYETMLQCNECGFSSVESVKNVFPIIDELIAPYRDTFRGDK